MSEKHSDTQAAIDAGKEIGAQQPVKLERGELYVFPGRNGAGEAEVLDTNTDEYLDAPRRKRGSITLRDAASFVAYWKKHSLPESEVFTDLDAQTVTAVIDAHGAAGETAADELGHGIAGWAEHRATLQVRKTEQWKAWEAINRKMLSQVEFAEFIEDRVDDIVSPPGAEMLELAMTFQAKKGVEFKSSNILSSSQRELVYTEDVQATAGRGGNIVIPALVELGLQPFEGSDAYKVLARLRYRLTEGHLSLGLFLVDPNKVLREVFGDILTTIEADLDGTPIMRGAPGR